MGVMNIYHPDIELFINAKSADANRLNHFNLSVMIDDKFMEAVEKKEKIFLHFPVYNDDGTICEDDSKWKIKKSVDANYLWNMIIHKAYDNGEPGVFFYDNMNKDNNLYYIEKIVCSNPCAEYLAGTVYGEHLKSEDFGGACNLGSLFLHNFVIHPFEKDAIVDYTSMKKAIKTGVRMLDNIIDINKFPDKIYENYQKSFRTIGFGVTGLADMLVMLNMKYNSKEATDFVDELMDFISSQIYKESIELAKEKGSFPLLEKEKFVKSGYMRKNISHNWDGVIDDILKYGIRNSKMISIAPTGTLSLTYGNNCSSGIEPIFSLTYDRKVKLGGQSEEDTQIVKMEDFAYSICPNKETNPNFVTAMNMTVNEHVDMLSVIAKHVDMSVSKTINVPTEYSFDDTKNIYMRCWKSGIKGCTIFRPNELRKGILITENKDKKTTDNKVQEKKAKELGYGDIVPINDNVIGKKRRITNGCGHTHCEAFFDSKTGELRETFFSKGSEGGCNSFMVGLSRMISLCARAGVSIYEIVDQLNSCVACPSYAVRKATKHDTSKGSCCPMAIGYAILEMYKEVQDELFGSPKKDEKDTSIKPVIKSVESKPSPVTPVSDNIPRCPECGEPLTFEGGCNVCKNCGWSKCS